MDKNTKLIENINRKIPKYDSYIILRKNVHNSIIQVLAQLNAIKDTFPCTKNHYRSISFLLGRPVHTTGRPPSVSGGRC